MNIASFIDHTILKPSTSSEEIINLCEEAIQYHFAAVCVPPYFVSQAAQLVQNSGVKVATVVGFPFGYQHYSAKVAEAKQAVRDGINEVDMVMNIAAFKNKDFTCLQEEISGLLNVAKSYNVVVKVIIESGILTNEEIIQCCHFYKGYPVDFLKTSTGYADKGASIEAIRLMREHLPKQIQIKASGGIKTKAFAMDLIDAGADRLGCSASVAIVTDEIAAKSSY